MANPRTGNREAVAQTSVRLIDGLLASLHQNAVHDDAPLKLIHGATLRIGDPYRPDPGDLRGDFGD